MSGIELMICRNSSQPTLRIGHAIQEKGKPYWQYDRTFTIKGERYLVRGSTRESRKTLNRAVEVAEVNAARQRALHGEIELTTSLDEAIGTYFANIAMHQPSSKTTQYQTNSLLRGLRKPTTQSSIYYGMLSLNTQRQLPTLL